MNTRRASALTSVLRLSFGFGPTACSDGPSSPEKEACVQTAAASQTCPGGAIVQGVDVSVYQGTIAWPLVRAAGKDFAFARISDGVGFIDAEFARNWDGMKASGLVRGAYQYFRASEDPIAEANVVTSSLRSAGGLSPDDLPVVMDIESADGQPASIVRDHMATWLTTVEKVTGKLPIVYTNLDTSALIGTGFGGYGLWVANWGARCPAMPAGWPDWAFWQYSDIGTIPGIAGAVDLDEFDGARAHLGAFEGSVAGDGGAEPIADASEGDGARTASAVPALSRMRPRPCAAVGAGAAMGDGANVASPAAARCRLP